MNEKLKYGEPVLTEAQCALLETLVPKPFKDLPIKPTESKRYKTEAQAEAMAEWEQLKSKCVLLKKAR